MQSLSVRRFVAVYLLTLFGYFGNLACAGSVLMNSNAIKNVPSAGGGGGGGQGGSKPGQADPVSPSPRTSTSGSVGHRIPPVDPVQSGGCTDDDECGADEFCNDVRGACLPCRKSRKRCARDSMCCSGNRCSNGVCQPAIDLEGIDAAATITGWHGGHSNNTMEHHAKRPPSGHGHQPHSVKGQEGDTCLRSADCSEGLCCARHFWSRICKPVLTEGQVCTRHRRKGAHGLELFQRCDCGDSLACRPERGGGGGGGGGERERGERGGERDHAVSRTAARNLHTCQRR